MRKRVVGNPEEPSKIEGKIKSSKRQAEQGTQSKKAAAAVTSKNPKDQTKREAKSGI